MKKLLLALLLASSSALAVDVKLSALPLGSASTTGGSDSFPYVAAATNVTKRLTLWDLPNIPTLVSTYAPLASPTLSGTVTLSGLTTGVVHAGSGGALTSSLLVNADVSASAALARSKLASGSAYRLLVNDVSGAMTEASALTNGQLLIGSTGVAPVAASLTGTSNQVVVTPGAGTITLSTPQSIGTGSSPTFTGLTLSGTLDVTGASRFRSDFYGDLANDAATGSAQTLTAAATPIVRLTSGTLTSVAGVPAGANGQFLVLMNVTGASVSVLDESASATAVNRIRTGSGGTFTFQANASVFLIYDSTSTRWRLIGGGGGGTTISGTQASPVAVVAGTGVVAPSTPSDQLSYIQGSGGAVSISANPQIAAGLADGQKYCLRGTSSTNTVSMTNGTGLVMNGAIQLGAYDQICFQWDLTNWVEVDRNF